MLPEAAEVELLGNVAFRVATHTFAVFEMVEEVEVITVKLPLDQQEALVATEGFEAAPITGSYGWTNIRLDRGVEWDEIDRLVVASYRGQAPEHLQRALDRLLAGGL